MHEVKNEDEIIYNIDPRSKGARSAVEKFCAEYIWLKSVWNIFIELFHDPDNLRRIDKVANAFFGDLNIILREYSLMKLCAMIDRRADKYGNENLTLENLIQTIDWPKEKKDQLEKLNKMVNGFGEKIRSARNKIIAHHDKRAYINRKTMGEFKEGEDKEFMENLETACNIMHEESVGAILGHIVLSQKGDVMDLKSTLQDALAFRKLIDEKSKSPECSVEEFRTLMDLRK